MAGIFTLESSLNLMAGLIPEVASQEFETTERRGKAVFQLQGKGGWPDNPPPSSDCDLFGRSAFAVIVRPIPERRS